MKKKSQKRIFDTLAILAFVMQAAELGIRIWETVKREQAAEADKKGAKKG